MGGVAVGGKLQDLLFTEAVEAVHALDADHRRHVDLEADVEVVAAAQASRIAHDALLSDG